MNDKVIKCFYCGKQIKSKEDLITAAYFIFRVKPYHSSCYSKRLNSLENLFLGNQPLNGIWGNISAFLSPLIVLIVLLRVGLSWIFAALILIIGILPIALRL